MIFKNIFKGTDVDFDISLEKTEYTPGETVRGQVTLHTGKGAKARQLRLFAEGKESTIIYVNSPGRSGSGSNWDSDTCREVNTFFSEDLSHLLQESVSSNALEDGTLEILPQTKEVAVEFTLPSDNRLFSSYKGKHANITYTLKATMDVEKNLDVNKEEIFTVFNPNNNKVIHTYSNKGDGRATAENEDISFPSVSVAAAEDSDNNKVKRGYSARFESIFGKKTDNSSMKRGSYPESHGRGVTFDLGTLLTKDRDNYLKKNSEARIDLLNHGNDNGYNAVFSPGQTLNGKVIVFSSLNQDEEGNKKKDIRGMNITLSGTEHAFAQEYKRVSTVEKYEKKIEVIKNGNANGGNDTDFPFEFQIPDGIRQSYIGKYSEYFWGLESKINIAWSSDIIARTIIEIV